MYLVVDAMWNYCLKCLFHFPWKCEYKFIPCFWSKYFVSKKFYTYNSDKDECTDDGSLCHVNAICTNTEGSHTCTCKTGYEGDGHDCQG